MAETVENPLKSKLEEVQNQKTDATRKLEKAETKVKRLDAVEQSLSSDIADLNAALEAYGKEEESLRDQAENLQRTFAREARCLDELLSDDNLTIVRDIHAELSGPMKTRATALVIDESDYQPLLDSIRAATYQALGLPGEPADLGDDYKTKIHDGFVRTQAATRDSTSSAHKTAITAYEHYKQLASRIQDEHKRLDQLSTRMSVALNENQPGTSYYVLHHLYEEHQHELPIDVITVGALADRILSAWNTLETTRASFNNAVDALAARETEFNERWQALVDQIAADTNAVVEELAAMQPQNLTATNTDQKSGDNDA